MKKTIILTGLMLIILNLLLGLLLSFYGWINVTASSLVVVVVVALLLVVNEVTLKDGFKAALTILFALAGLLQYIIACFMPNRWEDNWGLIVIVILVVLQAFLLMACHIVSCKIK